MTKINLSNREFYRLVYEKTIKTNFIYNLEEFGLKYVKAVMFPNSIIEYHLDLINEKLFFLSVIKFNIDYKIIQ